MPADLEEQVWVEEPEMLRCRRCCLTLGAGAAKEAQHEQVRPFSRLNLLLAVASCDSNLVSAGRVWFSGIRLRPSSFRSRSEAVLPRL